MSRRNPVLAQADAARTKTQRAERAVVAAAERWFDARTSLTQVDALNGCARAVAALREARKAGRR